MIIDLLMTANYGISLYTNCRLESIIIIMQIDPQPPKQRQVARRVYFNLNKSVQNWDEFRNTWKQVKIDDSLNTADQQALRDFWMPILKELTEETERICILAPSQVQKGGNPKAKKIKLKPVIFEVAMQLIKQHFPTLDCTYESLFLGNDKQLMAYRSCNAIEKYLEKYRLPKDFKNVFAPMESLAAQLFEVKIQRNQAISTFNYEQIARTENLYKSLDANLKEALITNRDYFRRVFQDFKSKTKVREIQLMGVRQELRELLREMTLSFDLDILNRYNECEGDQLKDIAIVRLTDIRLNPIQLGPDIEEPAIQYIYVDPPVEPKPPKDIRDLIFKGIDIAKQCYRYEIDLPRSGVEHKLQGIFIRSAEGQECYQLNIPIQSSETKKIDVDIYPFAKGKITYEIYSWNQIGFTKCTEKIVVYNELRVGKEPIKKNKSIHMLGQSQFGLLIDCESTNNQWKTLTYPATSLALGNGAVLCDTEGNCAGWGQMFALCENEEQEEEDDMVVKNLGLNFRIEKPVLLLQHQQIRKVSCGTGYFLMLSCWGNIWSMGINQFGQLGLGNFDSDLQCMNPRRICKFTGGNSHFFVDIHANECGSSFAMEASGTLYRWGLNQVEESLSPVKDRFQTITNYTSGGIMHKCPNPFSTSKQYLRGQVTQVESGAQYYLALTKEGDLFGWGQCRMLGRGPLLDLKEQAIPDILNPIQIMSKIEFITAAFDHAIAITKDKRILAWGNSLSFSNKRNLGFCEKPIDVTEEYGGSENIKIVKSGRRYTVVVDNSNSIRLFGEREAFEKEEYIFHDQIVDVQCAYENMIAVLAEKKEKNS